MSTNKFQQVNIDTNQQLQIQNHKQQQQHLLQSQYPSRQINLIYPEFQIMYNLSLKKLNLQTQQKIKKWTEHREIENYLYFIQPQKFVNFTKNQRLQHFRQNNTQLVTFYLLQAMKIKQFKIENDILNDVLTIQKSNKNKKQVNNVQKIQQLTQQQMKGQQQQLRKRHQQILRQQRKQKARLQKLKQKQQQIKKQQQQHKFQEHQKQKQQMKRNQSQNIHKKLVEGKQKRQKQKKQIQQRNKDYSYIIKSWATNQVLHQKMQRNFKKRYDSLIQQDRKKVQSQRSRLSLNARVQDLKIKQHQNKYLQWKSQNQAVRASKMQQQQRMIQMYQKQLKKLKVKKSNQKDNSDQQNNDSQDQDKQKSQTSRHKKDKTYQQLKQQKRRIALEKRKKMETYWQSFVKQQRQPKIDVKKQQQLQNIIQTLQNARRMRKVKNQKGQYIYEQVKLSDPTLKGMQYLQHSRELGRMRKSLKRKDSEDDKSSIHQQNEKKKRSVDYLRRLRQSRSQSIGNSTGGMGNKLLFLQKKDQSFHDKLQKVQRQSFKLQQLTKNSQNQLKYGKFKTSQQILQYKQDIDNNHIQILRMKLKLAATNNVKK